MYITLTDTADSILAHIYFLSTQLAAVSITTAISVMTSTSASTIPWNRHNGSPQTSNGAGTACGVVKGVVGLAAIMVAASFSLRYWK